MYEIRPRLSYDSRLESPWPEQSIPLQRYCCLTMFVNPLHDRDNIDSSKVLAALDVHTAKWIVEKCFKGDLIAGRTVILVVCSNRCIN